MAAQIEAYPLRFDVQYPGRLSRWLIFVKWLLAIPHFFILWALGTLQGVVTFIAFFSILFTKRYPQGLFDLYVNSARWAANVGAYVGLLRDEYPPFTWESGKYPITYDVDYPEGLSRWMILIKWLLVLPHAIVLGVLSIAVFVVMVVAWFAILFTAQFPRGMFDFVVGYTRWAYRVGVYTALLRDEYPPFTLR